MLSLQSPAAFAGAPAPTRPAPSAPPPAVALAADPAFAPFAAEPAILAFLADPVTALAADPVPAAYQPILLSNLAEGCVHRVTGGVDGDEKWSLAARCADAVAAIAETRLLSDTGSLPRDTLALAHLVIVLAAAQHADQSARWDDPRHDRLVRAADELAVRTLADPNAIPRSFEMDTGRWPADAAAGIYALWLADHVAPAESGVLRHTEPARRFAAWNAGAGKSPQWGLPISEASGQNATSAMPRGCALSWTVRYQAGFDPTGAAKLWAKYKALYFVDAGVAVGFREWPPATDRPADADSGPVVGGVGAAATALAIGASSLVGDTDTHARLLATEAMMTAAAGAWPDGRVATGVLARAIAVNQYGLTPWFRPGVE